MVAIFYLVHVIKYRDTFDVRIRLPSLTITEVIILQLCVTTTCLREIFEACGAQFPFQVQDISFVGVVLLMTAFIPLRCAQFILVFDPSIRKIYHKHFQRFKKMFLLLVAVLAVIFYIILLHSGTAACFTM